MKQNSFYVECLTPRLVPKLEDHVSLLLISLFSKAVMVLYEITSAHALAPGGTNCAGRWICEL